MLSDLLKNSKFFFQLFNIDRHTAEECKKKRCPYCGGPLHYANYARKPRGELVDLPEEYRVKFSLCCGREGCRRRITPSSCRFMGRKVYWYCAILIIMTLRHNGFSIYNLCKKFKISHKTINRWIAFYQNTFPSLPQWQRIRGLIPASVKNNELPGGLVNYFIKLKTSVEDALKSCLEFLSQGQSALEK